MKKMGKSKHGTFEAILVLQRFKGRLRLWVMYLQRMSWVAALWSVCVIGISSLGMHHPSVPGGCGWMEMQWKKVGTKKARNDVKKEVAAWLTPQNCVATWHHLMLKACAEIALGCHAASLTLESVEDVQMGVSGPLMILLVVVLMWLRYQRGPWLIRLYQKPKAWNETDITRGRSDVSGLASLFFCSLESPWLCW